MKKAVLILLAVVMIVSLFAGCGTDAKTPVPTTTPAQTGQATEKPRDTQAPDESAEPEGPEALTLPIVSEKVTYSIWNGPMSLTARMETPGDSTAYQELERRTNIHIEWNQPAQAQAQEQFNLIVASNNYPDVFMYGDVTLYVGGYDRFISDEIIRDLSELVAKYAPNYHALRNSDETIRRYTSTDSGNVPYFRTISAEREPTWLGVWARQDWLDKSGMGIVANNVETYDDFRQMLVALKDYASVAPYYLWSGKTGMEEYLMTGYGVLSGYVNRNGKAVFGPTDPGYYDYLVMMNEWFDEGLIDPEFFARAGMFGGDMAKAITGEFGAFQFLYMSTMIEMQAPPEMGMDLQGVTLPVKNKGDIRKLTHFGVPHTVMGGGHATITYNSQDVVPLIKWLDYLFSEEGALLADYGLEGEGYVMGADGRPEMTELIYANPDDLSSSDAQFQYAIGPLHPHLYSWERGFMPNFPEKAAKVGRDIWDRDYVESETMPEVAISTEESAEYASMMNDIMTFVHENTIKFIIGQKSLDEWQTYVDWINSHGIVRCTEIQQAALDRYFTR